MINELLYIGIITVLVVVVIIQLVINYRQTKDVLNAANETVTNITNSPLWMKLATAAADNVPQDTFNAVYNKTDAVEAFLGDNSPIAQLVQRLEDALKRVDHDPANDPDQLSKPPVVNG
jgi:hypothetical protein